MVFVVYEIQPASVERFGRPNGNYPYTLGVFSTRELAEECRKEFLDTQYHTITPVSKEMTAENLYTVYGRPEDFKTIHTVDFGGFVIEEIPEFRGYETWEIYILEPTADVGTSNFPRLLTIVNDEAAARDVIKQEIRKISKFTPVENTMTIDNQYTVFANPSNYDFNNCAGCGGFVIQQREMITTLEEVRMMYRHVVVHV